MWIDDTLRGLILAGHAFMYRPVGSRRTCSPAPVDTDDDYLVWVKDTYKFKEALGPEWDQEGTDYDSLSQFVSFRRGGVNFIVTDSYNFFEKFQLATWVARELNLLNKGHRKTLFQAILYGATVKFPCG